MFGHDCDAAWRVTCDRCGRLLNRATGRCVCDDYEGGAPAPVSITHPPAEASHTVSKAAAMALLDPNQRSPRPVAVAPPPPPSEPPPPPPTPGQALGVLRRARAGRHRVDVVVYDGKIVLARRGAPMNLSAGQLAAQDSTSRVLDDAMVDDVVVREDVAGGKAVIQRRGGERIVVSWPGLRNRGVSGENLLAHAFSGKVDQGASQLTSRIIRRVLLVAIAAIVAVGAWMGVSALLAEDPPPPPPPAPPVTLPPAEQAARDELRDVCGSWASFAASVGVGDRPDPVALRPLAGSLRPRFDAAALAVADYAPARDEVVYLQDYSAKPLDAVARESSSRISYAVTTVSAACTRATSAPAP